MIKELEAYAITDIYGNTYGMRYASNSELQEKINEIIRHINEMEERKNEK